MELQGKVIAVLPERSGVSARGEWKSQSFVIETGGNYPKKIALTLWGEDKINEYDLQPGLEATFHINLESREYNGRWYTEARAWKIEWTAEGARPLQTGTSSYKAPEPVKQENAFDSMADDLPF